MSKKLARFIDRHPHMFAEYRAFAIEAINKANAKKIAAAASAAQV
jgi:hypothetical protein